MTRDTNPGEVRVTDPAALEAIEAVLMLAVYRARRAARRQLLAIDRPPVASPEALHLHRVGSLR